ncbi:MAG: UDP-N-acetylglucosamine 2-epimerase (non-hydrolyzing) [Candidatus Aminicenantes bacterium]|nr:UDP-N-acetylglucosamine 2-epimerase (non-hydrolyzing) [Candidatus Aminicenantes bacterium]
MKIFSVIGARPQFIKLAPIVRAFNQDEGRSGSGKIIHGIVHTGQHYDYLMNKVFFENLGLPEPDFNLEVGSASHAKQTGVMLELIEQVLENERPDWVLVYGDTNSTLAGALAAVKMGISVGHIEAGLRSFNRRMPEEINRILADRCAEALFCPTENACRILKNEGCPLIVNEGKLIKNIARSGIGGETRRPFAVNVGDVMYDASLMALKAGKRLSGILSSLGLKRGEYYLATIHRAENTDVRSRLEILIESLAELGRKAPVVFPVHPRTKQRLEQFHIKVPFSQGLKLCDPVGYTDMLILEESARCILTDSGGIQKEAFFFGIPCLTLRDETEWIETVASGDNVLTGISKESILTAALGISSKAKKGRIAGPFGDGKAAEKVKDVLVQLAG